LERFDQLDLCTHKAVVDACALASPFSGAKINYEFSLNIGQSFDRVRYIT